MKNNLIILFFLFSLTANAQNTSNIKAGLSGNNVEVTYDLAGEAGTLYTVNLFGSHDNFEVPLKLVSGHVGENIEAGTGKSIIWDYTKENVNTDNISFKVKAEMTFDPATLKLSGNFTMPPKVKRKNKVQVAWGKANPSQNVKIDLLRKGEFVKTLTYSTENQGTYVWDVLKDNKTKKGYSLKVSDVKDANNYMMSETFAIKPEKPRILRGILWGGGILLSVIGLYTLLYY